MAWRRKTKLALEAHFTIAVERERIQANIRAKVYGRLVVLGVNNEHYQETTLESTIDI